MDSSDKPDFYFVNKIIFQSFPKIMTTGNKVVAKVEFISLFQSIKEF